MLESKMPDPIKPQGPGWFHRIDDVPMVGERIEIITHDGEQFSARVLAASPEEQRTFSGMGSHVAYHVADMNTLNAGAVVWLRRSA